MMRRMMIFIQEKVIKEVLKNFKMVKREKNLRILK
jgi:hypothetical protein